MGIGVVCSSGGMDGWLGWMCGKVSWDCVWIIFCFVKFLKVKYIVVVCMEG